MATPEDVDTSRSVVKTYVPAYQKERWATHADELDMSHSEYVRSMVQAGRRGFGGEGGASNPTPETNGDGQVPGASVDDRPSDPDDVTSMERHVLARLSTEEHRSWDAILDDLTAEVEDILQTMQADGRLLHSPRNGGYVLVDDDER